MQSQSSTLTTSTSSNISHFKSIGSEPGPICGTVASRRVSPDNLVSRIVSDFETSTRFDLPASLVPRSIYDGNLHWDFYHISHSTNSSYPPRVFPSTTSPTYSYVSSTAVDFHSTTTFSVNGKSPLPRRCSRTNILATIIDSDNKIDAHADSISSCHLSGGKNDRNSNNDPGSKCVREANDIVYATTSSHSCSFCPALDKFNDLNYIMDYTMDSGVTDDNIPEKKLNEAQSNAPDDAINNSIVDFDCFVKMNTTNVRRPSKKPIPVTLTNCTRTIPDCDLTSAITRTMFNTTTGSGYYMVATTTSVMVAPITTIFQTNLVTAITVTSSYVEARITIASTFSASDVAPVFTSSLSDAITPFSDNFTVSLGSNVNVADSPAFSLSSLKPKFSQEQFLVFNKTEINSNFPSQRKYLREGGDDERKKAGVAEGQDFGVTGVAEREKGEREAEEKEEKGFKTREVELDLIQRCVFTSAITTSGFCGTQSGRNRKDVALLYTPCALSSYSSPSSSTTTTTSSSALSITSSSSSSRTPPLRTPPSPLVLSAANLVFSAPLPGSSKVQRRLTQDRGFGSSFLDWAPLVSSACSWRNPCQPFSLNSASTLSGECSFSREALSERPFVRPSVVLSNFSKS